ncbi:short-chain dehydrogenase reductase ATA1-like [Hevea brasiliensis]|uniref:short-chain dehydrogenase reductase ATA1-like n=1 Tax=Hevea brasiliensis TaxID=3981 RepID=UPI0025E2F11F|nr:short-chain dehydrogenase reductase ATA1-like [Hevea brasiliensis]
MESHIHMHDDVQRLPADRLRVKVAVITGGARGIGVATAKLFAENGANDVTANILDNMGSSLAESIGGRYIRCDVANEADAESAINPALAWKGKLDIMFNNAGPNWSITNLDMEKAKHLFSVNVNGNLHGIKHAARAMIESRNGGSIMRTASSAAIMGALGSHAYTLSKGAIVGLMKSTACELGVYGIRGNCISPHGVPSEMLFSAYRRILGKEDMKPEEVGKIVGEREVFCEGDMQM